jgi:hypothetical protein
MIGLLVSSFCSLLLMIDTNLAMIDVFPNPDDAIRAKVIPLK